MTKLKSKKITKSTFAVIIMAIAMVALLAFGGTYAYFTAQANTLATRSFNTGKVVLTDNSKSLTFVAEGAAIVPEDEIISGGIVYTNASTVDTYVAVVVKLVVGTTPATKDTINSLINLGVAGTWEAIDETGAVVYVYKNTKKPDGKDDWTVEKSNTELNFSSKVTFAADEHTEDGVNEKGDASVQDKQIALTITAYQTQAREDNAFTAKASATEVWTAMKAMLGADYQA